MSAATLRVQNLSWTPKQATKMLLHPTDFELQAGRVLGVVGPNGAGKTTLLRLLYRYHRPTSGTVTLGGKDIWRLSARAAARQVAAVLQEQTTDFALTVRDIVALGRTPHQRGFPGPARAEDARVVEHALDLLHLTPLATRHLGTLSGGERQRVMVARALAQQPQLLILDEPTNHLDIRHQLEVLELIRTLPLTIVTSLHDLNLAAGLCDDVLLLHAGHTVGFGPPDHVLCEGAVSDAFQVIAHKEQLSHSQIDHFTYHLRNTGTHP
ncbi:MAG: ABC transporter ATP-binding protein [Pseudomonadota bacterium]